MREKESNIDSLITPIEEMYGLLLRYEVRLDAIFAVKCRRSSATGCRQACSSNAQWAAPGQLQMTTAHAARPRRPQVRVPKEETALVSDLRYGWRKLRKLTTDVSDNLARLQVRRPALVGSSALFTG